MESEESQQELPAIPDLPEEQVKETPASLSRRGFFRALGAATATGAASAFGMNTPITKHEGAPFDDISVSELSETVPFSYEAKTRLGEIVDEDYQRLKTIIWKNFPQHNGATKNYVFTMNDADQEKRIDSFAKKLSLFVEHPESIKIGNASINIIGVSHSAETIIACQKKLEEAISAVDAVFVEGTPHASGLGKPVDLARFINKYRPDTHAAEHIERWILKDPFQQFFGHTELLSAKHNKPVLTADPDTGGKHLYEMAIFGSKSMNTPLRDMDEKMLPLLMLGASASVLTGVATTITGGLESNEIPWKAMASRERGVSEEEIAEETSKRKHVSRRKFLVGSILTALGSGTTMGLVPTVKALGSYDPYYGNIEPGLIYNLIDYRNTVTAEAIKRYVETHPDKKNILVIYGNAHRVALAQYLQNPALLATKHTLYAPYRSQTTEDLEEFRYRLFDKTDPTTGEPGKWVKTYEEKLD